MIRNLIRFSDGRELFSGEEGAAIMEVSLTQSVNSREELTLGSVCCAMLEFTVFDPEGLGLTAGEEVTLWAVADDGVRTQQGVFILEKPVRAGAARWNVTAYDRVSRLDRDVTAWFNALSGSYTLLEMAGLVCKKCGVTLANDSLPNGSFVLPKVTVKQATGRQVIQWLGEAAGRFCRATSEGQIEFGWYTPTSVTLGPRSITEAAVWADEKGNVTVEDIDAKTLDDNRGAVWVTSQGLSMEDDGQGNAALSAVDREEQLPWFMGQLELADYRVAPVEAVQLKLSEESLWPAAAEDANAYIISANPFLNGLTEAVGGVLQTLAAQLSPLTYTPCKVTIPATNQAQPGSIITLKDTQGKAHTLYVMSKTRKGQRDTLECTGSPRRDSATAQNNKTLSQIVQEKVDGQTQQDIFSKLTNGGKTKGIYLEDGELYINATYIKSGELLADLIRAGVLSSTDGKTKFDLSDGVITTLGSDGDGGVARLQLGSGTIQFAVDKDSAGVYADALRIDAYQGVSRIAANGEVSLSGGTATFVGGDAGSTVVRGTTMLLSAGDISVAGALRINGKAVSWKENPDGTYTLIGT